MRHLIDTYIEADEPRKISPFDGMGLLDLIVENGDRRRHRQATVRPQGEHERHRGNHREQRPKARSSRNT